MVHIRIQFPNGATAERSLAQGTYSIGREAGDIVLGDPNVSGRHAELLVDASGITVRDVGSTNGTFDAHGNRLAAPIRLGENQWVRMGASAITVLSGAPVAAAMPPGGGASAGFVPSPGFAPPDPNAFPPPQPAFGQAPQPAYRQQAVQPAYGQQAAQPAYGQQAPQPAYGQQAPQPAYGQQAVQPPQYGQQAVQPPQYGQQAVQPPQYGQQAAQPPRYGQPPAPAPGGHAAAGFALPKASGYGFSEGEGPSSAYSHPEQPVRHSYPLSQQGFGVGAAFALLMKTSPFVMARLGALLTLSFVSLVYWFIVIGGFVILAPRSPVVGYAWLFATLIAAGWVWRTFVRYFLHLLKSAHIAVLTEVITQGRVGNGSEGMFAYGKRVVTERFGEVNVLFAVDMLIDGIVRAFNRTLDWVANLIPVPGLDHVMAFVKAVLRASTTYVDESIFSYNLARGDANVYRSSKDGLVYYAQNSKEILKTGVLVVILERVLSFFLFWVIFAPTLALAYLLPNAFGGWIPITAIIAGLLVANSVRQAFLRPLFLTMLLLKFHSLVQGQPIDLAWDQRLEGVTNKFRELKDKAAQWVARPAAPPPVPQPTPAE